MRKLFLVACLLLGAALPAAGQGGFTTVTGTITGPIDGIVWSCGSISAQLITAGGAAPTLNGQGFSTSTSPIALGCPTSPGTGAAGSFAMRLADSGVIVPSNTTWKFTVNMTPGIAPPAGTGPQSFSFTTAINCSTNTPATCTANSMDISTQLSALAPKLSNAGTGGSSFPVTTSVAVNSGGTITVNTGGSIVAAGTGTITATNGINKVGSLPALPCTNNTLVQLTVAPFSIFKCIGGVWIEEGANGQVLETSYGVLADGIVINAGNLFTVTSGSSNFTVTGGPGLLASDVGKAIFATQWGGADGTGGASCMTTASPTTIATVTSSTTGTLSQNAIANCGTTNANVGVLFYGHDDTAARALAKAAAFDGSVCGLELIPAGLSLQTTGQWNTSTCPGIGVGSTLSHYASVGGIAPGNVSVIIIAPWFTVSSCTGNASGSSNDCFGSSPASGFTNLSFNGLGDTSTSFTGKHFIDTTNDAVYQNLILELLTSSNMVGFTVNNGNHGISNLIVDQFGGSSGPFLVLSNNAQVFEMFIGNTTSANGEVQLTSGVLQCYSCAVFPTGTGTGATWNLGSASILYDYNSFNLNGSTNSSATYLIQNTSRAYLYGVNANNTGNTGNSVIDVLNTGQAYLMAGSRVQGGATGSIWAGCASGTICKDDGTNVEVAPVVGAGAIVLTDNPAGFVSKTGQTANIAATPLFTVGTANTQFQASGSVACDSTSAAATVLVTILYTDVSNTAQTVASAVATCTALGAASTNSIVTTFIAKGGTNIQYSTTIANTPTYDVRVNIMQQGLN